MNANDLRRRAAELLSQAEALLAGVPEGEEPPADVFAEFFRNIVVHRDDSPRVPGELLTLTLPELPSTDAGAEA